MDLKDSLVTGRVLITHQIHDGKHQYEVENVMKYTKAGGGKKFIRKGDKLMQINGKDLDNFTPEELAQAISEGNPKLTLHKPGKMVEPAEGTIPAEDTFQAVSKESRILNFSMELVREDDLEESEGRPGAGGGEDGGTEEGVCQPEDEENRQEKDLVIVSMTKTSITVVSGRSCDSESSCKGCHGTGCTLHDVVMVTESSKVTLVPRGGGSFRHLKTLDTPIEHVATQNYLRGLCSQKTLYISPNPEKMTIYSYKPNRVEKPFRGMPVVLNFTGSDCFLRCCKTGAKVLLQVEACEKRKLRHISKNDGSALSFVFYMKSNRTDQRKFESALHQGWYMQIANTESVEMATMEENQEHHLFLFIIQT